MGVKKLKFTHLSIFIAALIILTCINATGTSISFKNHNDTAEFVPGEIIVGFHSSDTDEGEDLKSLGLDVVDLSSPSFTTFKNYQIKRKTEEMNFAVFKVKSGEEYNAIENMLDSPLVKYAHLNYIARACGYTPNDPQYDNQWQLRDYGSYTINIPDAWERVGGRKKGGQGDVVIIAIIDSGVDYNHEDLKGRVIKGYDYANDDSDPMDDNGHGTRCAGIAAAIMDNEKGIAGVSQANILAVKVADSNCQTTAENVAKGIDYARRVGVDIISMSFESDNHAGNVEQACNDAWNAGIFLVAASGNGNKNQVSYPARYDKVMAVGAINYQGKRLVKGSEGSNYGEELDIVAPGEDIYTIKPNNRYTGAADGTSFACPHVAGVAALILSGKVPSQYGTSWDPSEIKERLLSKAEPIGSSNEFGHGLVDADASVYAADLELDGDLDFGKKKKGGTYTKTFDIENNGNSGATLNWEVEYCPSWCSLSQKEGSGTKTITVTINVPNEDGWSKSDSIFIINKDSGALFYHDIEEISISIYTEKSKQFIKPIIFNFFENFKFLRLFNFFNFKLH
jgi:hypothetical protein